MCRMEVDLFVALIADQTYKKILLSNANREIRIEILTQCMFKLVGPNVSDHPVPIIVAVFPENRKSTIIGTR